MAMSEVSLNLIIRASDLASEVLDGLIDNLQGVADAVSDIIAADAATMQELLAQMGQFRDAATAANLDMTNLNANLAGTTDQATDSVNELVPAVGTAGTEVGAFGEVVADTASPLGALSADLALAEAGSISLGEGADTAQEAIEGVNEQTTTVAASVDALGVSMDTAATQTDAAMDSITAGVDGAVTSMDGLATGTDAAATSMAEGITAGVDAATISLDDLQTQVNAAVANFMALGTEATAAGDELAAGVTAGATDADAALDSMGATADTVGTEVDVSLDSIAASATATRDTLAGLGGSFSNVLMGAMAIGGGVMGLDALTGHAATTAESIAQVGAATGLTANQSTQLLAAFAAVGDNAQTATQMIQMLDKNLTSMSTTTIKQMNEFGVAVKDATGNALPLPDILNNVAAAYQTLGAQKGTEMLETIFGRSAVTLAPLIDGWTQISGLVSGIKSPFGDDTATKAYDADVIKLHTDMFQVSLDIAKIGEDITPAMEKVAKGLEDVLNDLTGGKGVIQAFEDWSKDIGAVGTAITGLSVGVAIIEGISIATKLAKDAQEAWAGIMLATNWVAFGIEIDGFVNCRGRGGYRNLAVDCGADGPGFCS